MRNKIDDMKTLLTAVCVIDEDDQSVIDQYLVCVCFEVYFESLSTSFQLVFQNEILLLSGKWMIREDDLSEMRTESIDHQPNDGNVSSLPVTYLLYSPDKV